MVTKGGYNTDLWWLLVIDADFQVVNGDLMLINVGK